MSKDIVERLRSPEFADVAEKYLMVEAADEIEKLREILRIHGIQHDVLYPRGKNGLER
jgi:hypothetical protein